MDPLFERRNLTKKVHIDSKFLQQNMAPQILTQLKMDYEGRCSSEGFINRNSITILKYSYPRTHYVRGGVDYDVTFQADVCFPHPGQRLKAPVTLRSKVGIHAETPPVKILIPRDIHIGQEEFENVKVGDEIEFEVVGSQFKQQDSDIIIVGKLLTKIPEPVEAPLNITSVAEPLATQPISSSSGSSEEKHVVITAPMEAEKPKKRKLRQNGGETINELAVSFKEGMDEGTN